MGFTLSRSCHLAAVALFGDEVSSSAGAAQALRWEKSVVTCVSMWF